MSVTFFALLNNASGNLSAPVDSYTDPVAVPLGAGEGENFPAANFPLSIDNEILLCTSRTDDICTCSRAQEGSPIEGHSIGANVQQKITAAMLTEIQTAINAIINGTTHFAAIACDGALTFGASGVCVIPTITSLDDPGQEHAIALHADTHILYAYRTGGSPHPWQVAY